MPGGMGKACCRARVPALALTAGAQGARKNISGIAVLYEQVRYGRGGEHRPSFYDDTVYSFPSVIMFHAVAVCDDVWRNAGVRSANEHAYKRPGGCGHAAVRRPDRSRGGSARQSLVASCNRDRRACGLSDL